MRGRVSSRDGAVRGRADVMVLEELDGNIGGGEGEARALPIELQTPLFRVKYVIRIIRTRRSMECCAEDFEATSPSRVVCAYLRALSYSFLTRKSGFKSYNRNWKIRLRAWRSLIYGKCSSYSFICDKRGPAVNTFFE